MVWVRTGRDLLEKVGTKKKVDDRGEASHVKEVKGRGIEEKGRGANETRQGQGQGKMAE